MQQQLLQSTCLKHCTNLSLHPNLQLPEELCLQRCANKYQEVLKMVIVEEPPKKVEQVQQPPKQKTFLKKLGF